MNERKPVPSLLLTTAAVVLASCSPAVMGGPDAASDGGDAALARDGEAGTQPADTSVPPDEGVLDTGSGDDAASGDDGAADVSPTDGAGGDGGAAGCAGRRYCDDFERYAVGSQPGAPWTASVSGGAMMRVDETRARSGARSLHITAPAGAGSRGTISQHDTAGLVPTNNLFGRVMVYVSVTGGNALPSNVHSWIFNASGMSAAAGGTVSMNLGGGGATPRYQLNYHWPPSPNEQSVQGGAWAGGAWHCVQWQYDGSGTPPRNEARVWVDGTMVINVGATQHWNFAVPWAAFDLGFTHYQTLASPVDIWIDDFALDNAAIPCPR